MNMRWMTTYHGAWGLMMLTAALVTWHWSVRPDTGVAWAATIATLLVMGAALLWSGRQPTRDTGQAAGAITNAVLFGALILACPLLVKTAGVALQLDHAEWSRRATMALSGGFLAALGNAFPKTLTPLAALHCNPGTVQAFQRFAGWTWVLTGLSFALVWMVLPIDLAKPLSVAIIVCGMVLVVAALVRLFLLRERRMIH
jgi:hypothetical protein